MPYNKLEKAILDNDYELVRTMPESDFVNLANRESIEATVKKNDIKMLEILLDRGISKLLCETTQSSLILKYAYKSPTIIKLLWKNLNLDIDKIGLLHDYTLHNDLLRMQMAVEDLNADVNGLSQDHCKPLGLAIEKSYGLAVNYLLQNGAIFSDGNLLLANKKNLRHLFTPYEKTVQYKNFKQDVNLDKNITINKNNYEDRFTKLEDEVKFLKKSNEELQKQLTQLLEKENKNPSYPRKLFS